MTAPTIVVGLAQTDPDTVEVTLVGDLLYDSGDEIVDRVTAHLAGHAATRTVQVNCRNLGICDSHGLSVLLMAQRAAGAAGARLQLLDMPPQLVRVLTITGLLEHLTAASRSGHRGHRET